MTTTATNVNPAAQPVAGWPQPAPSGMPVPPALTLKRRLVLPPPEAIRPHDEHAAEILDHVATVERAESAAAMDWQKATAWTDAFNADRAYVRDHVRRHGELPSDAQGPLADHPRRIECLYVHAHRCATWVEIAREDLIVYLQKDQALRKALDAHTDELRDRICAKWLHARDHQDRRALEDGYCLADEWKATNRLHAWAVKATVGYKSPLGPRTFPMELAYLEWEADAAVNGKARPEVPIEALSLPGAPLPADTTRGLPRPSAGPMSDEGTMVTGEPAPKRGLFGRRV